MDFLKEVFAALYPEHNYVNIKSPLPLIDINFILIGLYVGLVVGLAVACYRKRYMGKAVRAIIKEQAFSEETAKTPAELGLDKGRLLLGALRRRRFGGMVKQIGVDIEAKRPDYSDEKYYIPEEFRYQAEERYSTRGASVGSVIFWAIFFIPVFLVLRYIIPELLQLLDNFITSTK